MEKRWKARFGDDVVERILVGRQDAGLAPMKKGRSQKKHAADRLVGEVIIWRLGCLREAWRGGTILVPG